MLSAIITSIEQIKDLEADKNLNIEELARILRWCSATKGIEAPKESSYSTSTRAAVQLLYNSVVVLGTTIPKRLFLNYKKSKIEL